jgi:NADH dehydrogenase
MRILILGGGFGGIFTAMTLIKSLTDRKDIEIAMVNEENYSLYHPMLAEVISGNLAPLDVSVSIRDLCPGIKLHVSQIEDIDLRRKTVKIHDLLTSQHHTLTCDHLVIALGMKENLSIVRGLTEHGFHFKNLADALILRNHVIQILGRADNEEDAEVKRKLLTFVVAGGGFSGVEAAAEINDYVRGVAERFKNININDIRMVIIEGGSRLLSQFPESLSAYTFSLLSSRNIEIHLNTFLKAVTADMAILHDDTIIPTKTIVATIGIAPNPVAQELPCKKERGRIVVNNFMQVPDYEGIWAVGDCAYLIDYKTGESCPATAQYAVREGKRLGLNILAEIEGSSKTPFSFHCLGMLCSLGEYSAAGEILGIKISGFLAWLIWRFVYWSKLPGLRRKVQVAVDWFVNLILPYDIVNFNIEPTQNISREHFEANEVIFRQGDQGDRVYVILNGEVQIIRHDDNGHDNPIATLSKGECFGEMALITDSPRMATARSLSNVTVLSLDKSSFQSLFNNLPLLRDSFQQLVNNRLKSLTKETDSV